MSGRKSVPPMQFHSLRFEHQKNVLIRLLSAFAQKIIRTLGVVHRGWLLNRGKLMKSSYMATMSLPIVAYVVFLACCTQATAQTLYWNELIPGGGPGGNSAALSIKRSDIRGNAIST